MKSLLQYLKESLDKKEVLKFIMDKMKSAPHGGYHPTWRDDEVRDWGKWEVPPGEEDDGDYDWERLTDKSSKLLNDIVKEVKKKYPTAKIDVDIGEKNWITFNVR